MAGLLKNNTSWIMVLLFWGTMALSQSWHPAMKGIKSQQRGSLNSFDINFKPDGPMGKDWIYGVYLDEDSLYRCAAYREGGRWIPVPFSYKPGSSASDIVMYGDTLYISGSFGGIVLDKDSSTLPITSIVKWYMDSLWVALPKVISPRNMSVKGDSILLWGNYYDPPAPLTHPHILNVSNGASWQYPYSIIHPTDSVADFGPRTKLEILPNGDILTINNGTSLGNPFRGLSRWDGQQWQSYGNGLFNGQTYDFEFYKGELYMSGNFAKYNTWQGDTLSHIPQNPGNAVARWDGSQWQSLANGIVESGVHEMFVHDGVLYCLTFGGNPDHTQYGDAHIPYFAGWNGHQWCGTPFNFTLPPFNYGFINDTLFAAILGPTTVGGDTVSYLNYYDGDFLHGTNAICSTLGIGQEELPLQEQIKLFPNPASHQIQVSLKDDEIHDIEVYNLNGQKVISKSYEDLSAVELNILDLVQGVYFIRVNGEYNDRFIKE